MCVQDDTFIPKENESTASSRGKHATADQQCDPTFILQPWLMSDNIRMEKKKMAIGAHQVFNEPGSFAWCLITCIDLGENGSVQEGNSGARNFRPERQDDNEVSSWRENRKCLSWAIQLQLPHSLGASYLFFLFSYFIAAFRNQPVIFLVVAISYYLLWELAYPENGRHKNQLHRSIELYCIVLYPKIQ